MKTNNHQIADYDKVLDATFGKEGSEQRRLAEDKAYDFYTAQVIHDARKEATPAT